MGKVTKATKKFQSKQLKHVLDHRKKIKEFKQKTKGRRGNKNEQEKKDTQLTKEEQAAMKSKKEEVFKDMSVDDFFSGGFDVPQKMKAPSKKKTKSNEESSSEEEEDGDIDMDELKEKDPEFYKYLEENDKEVLEFSASNPLDDISEDEKDEENHEQKNDTSKETRDEDGKVEVSLKLVKQWHKALKEKPTLKLIRNVVSAFKAAVNLNNEEIAESFKYTVSNEAAFSELMFLALKDLPNAITEKLCPYKTKNNVRILPSTPIATKIGSILKHHAGSLITLLNDTTDSDTITLILGSTEQLLPFFLSHRKILKEIVNSVVELWSTSSNLEVQLTSYTFLLLCKEFKNAMLELVLKSSYSAIIKNCRQTNIRTMPSIDFQKDSAAQLFSIDPVLGYQIGFEYIRQLAIHLRNSINATTSTSKNASKVSPTEAYKKIYNWQFVHSIDFWSKVLATHCNIEKENNSLKELAYPLVQVAIGVIRLIPSAQFFPLRFYLCRSLINLSRNTGIFVPIFPILSEILQSTTFTKKPKGSTLEAFDFNHNIKCNAAYLGTRVYQEGCGELFIELLAEFYSLYCKSIAFPELTTPAIIALRRYIKTSKNVKFNKQLSVLLEKLNASNNFILRERSSVDFTPNNYSQVNNFLKEYNWEKTPLGSYVVTQREVKEEKMKILRSSLAEKDAEKNVEDSDEAEEERELVDDDEAEESSTTDNE
ncbi:probable Nucleolar complex protein 2 [Saccharomycodes ludwigii]|uniref:Probable Nucleolar complex protein 2 n=1 Tax=Saccharomycodes ludwigii TaxID=36035 RepID=A0A376B595_9ASCO|nr:hypothetical protein SCDLUD_002115 [Saccharomycodes ludwigii]KAH3902297.1 hypothetical protein SCDLUD_002115 [Saccharomycodes ludwigii]SSD59310.1 probable Nucleolar complex protein 2 [Saccharomycodes ludwigii]